MLCDQSNPMLYHRHNQSIVFLQILAATQTCKWFVLSYRRYIQRSKMHSIGLQIQIALPTRHWSRIQHPNRIFCEAQITCWHRSFQSHLLLQQQSYMCKLLFDFTPCAELRPQPHNILIHYYTTVETTNVSSTPLIAQNPNLSYASILQKQMVNHQLK